MSYRGNKGYNKNGRGGYYNSPGNSSYHSGGQQNGGHPVQGGGNFRGRGNKWISNDNYGHQGEGNKVYYGSNQGMHQGHPNEGMHMPRQSDFPPPSQHQGPMVNMPPPNAALASHFQLDPQPQMNPEEIVNNNMHQRAVFVFTNMMGQEVELLTSSNELFFGLFGGANTEGDLDVVLNYAVQLTDSRGNDVAPEPARTMLFRANDLESLDASDLIFNPSDVKEHGRSQGFKTDVGISGHSGDVRERELVSWVPDENLPISGQIESANQFVDEHGNWDQFAANKHLFNVETTYDELLYTTKIDRNAPNFAELERNAEILAREIMGKSSNNPHVLEERGIKQQDDGDEEAKYSSVARAITAGKYVPPSILARFQQHQAKSPEPVKNANLSPSQQSPQGPSKSASQANGDPAAKTTPKSNTARFLETLAVRDHQLRQASIKAAVPAPPVPVKKVAPGQTISQKKADAILQLFSSNPKSLSKPTQKKLFGETRPSKPIEQELMGTFRQFVSTEKERVKLGQQAKFKKDKDGKVAELKQFSLTFKLKTPVPEDIKSLVKSGVQPGSKPIKEGALPTISEKAEDEQKLETAAKPKLNINASEFKPNPSAKPFSPSVEVKKEVNAYFTTGKPTIRSDPVTWQYEQIKKKQFNDPSTQAPTWPTEGKPYRQQFNATPIDPQFNAGMQPMYPMPQFYPQFRYPNQMGYGPPMMNMPMQYLPNPHAPPYGYPAPPPHTSGQPMYSHPSPQMFYKHNDNPPMQGPPFPPSPGRMHHNQQMGPGPHPGPPGPHQIPPSGPQGPHPVPHNGPPGPHPGPPGPPSGPQVSHPGPPGPHQPSMTGPYPGPQGMPGNMYPGPPMPQSPLMARHPNDPNQRPPMMDQPYHQFPPRPPMQPHTNQPSQPMNHVSSPYLHNQPSPNPYPHQPFYPIHPQHYNPNFSPNHPQQHPNHHHNTRGQNKNKGRHNPNHEKPQN